MQGLALALEGRGKKTSTRLEPALKPAVPASDCWNAGSRTSSCARRLARSAAACWKRATTPPAAEQPTRCADRSEMDFARMCRNRAWDGSGRDRVPGSLRTRSPEFGSKVGSDSFRRWRSSRRNPWRRRSCAPSSFTKFASTSPILKTVCVSACRRRLSSMKRLRLPPRRCPPRSPGLANPLRRRGPGREPLHRRVCFRSVRRTGAVHSAAAQTLWHHGGPPVEALQDVSLDVRCGEVVGLVGPTGPARRRSCELRQDCWCPTADGDGPGTRLGATPCKSGGGSRTCRRSSASYEDLTVQENLDLYADLQGVEPAARASRYARF